MLSLFALVRFALSRSPTREQREIGFADRDPKDPKKPREEGATPEGGEEKKPGAPSPIEAGTRGAHAEISGVLRSLDIQQILEEMGRHLEHPETLESLFEREETLAQTNLYGVADRTGVLRALGGEANPPRPDDPPRILLDKILAFDREKGLPIAVKRDFVRTLTEENPQVTAALSQGLLRRLDVYGEQLRIVEQGRTLLTPEAMQEAVAIAREAMHPTIVPPGDERERATPSLDKSVRKLTGSLTSPEARRVRTLLKQTSTAIQITEDFGVRYWGESGAKPEHDEMRRRTYLRGLTEEAHKLAALLTLQIKHDAEHLASELEAHVKSLRGQAPTVSEDALCGPEGALVERLKRRVAEVENVGAPPPPISDDPAYPRELRAFIRERERQAKHLASIREDARGLISRRGREGLTQERAEQEEIDQWAERCLKMIPLILTDPTLSLEKSNELGALRDALSEPRIRHGSFRDERERFKKEWTLRKYVEEGEGYFLLAEQESERLEPSVSEALRTEGVARWTKERKEALTAAHADLVSLYTHPVYAALDIPRELNDYAEDLSGQLDTLIKDEEKPPDKQITPEEKRTMATEIGVRIEHWRTARDLLRTLERATSGEIPPEGNEIVIFLSDGAYRERFRSASRYSCYRDGKIYIRQTLDLNKQKVRSLVEHEKGHAIISILSDQSHLLIGLLDRSFDELNPENLALLNEQRERWGLPSQEEVRAEYRRLNPNFPEDLLRERADAHYRRLLLNEAAVKGALAAPGREDRRILETLRSKPARMVIPEFELPQAEPPQVDAEAMAQAPRSETSYDAKKDLDEIERWIMSIQTFGKAVGEGADPKGSGLNYNPAIKAQIDRILGTGRGDNGYLDNLAELKHIYNTEETRDGRKVPDPSHNPAFKQAVLDFKEKHVRKTYDQVREIDQKISDITEAPATQKRGLAALSQRLGIRWLCILDIVRIYKEFKEDVVTIWKTEQDRKTSEAAAALAGGLPSKIFGVNIPILGKYTERLAHYAERRRNDLELQRVKKWEDAFKNLGAEDLIDLIGKTPTADQLRASIELLVAKGRMNWADQRLWKALNEKSHYQMPFGPCERSEVLRDKWLRKLITDIWRDMDMFNEWMTKNQGNYDQHKKAYTHEADNFSNMSGGLSGELHFILQKYVECTTARPPKPLPDVVNPHHYEELLHYAMRMGKMRMEEKVFYLIHGITSGLMPLERLRVLSGERGELLMKFPFLDYFYQHHNSIPELRKIADRITEYEDGKPTLKPGAKTTMFIRLVLLRDDEARNRMSKASDRVAEQLDHEDIPYLATELDWVKMLALGGAMSGDRPKVTKEGWKNAYVGFNEKFKIYAHLAKLAAGGEAIFRESDIREIAKTIAAYITMDNVLMRITPMRPSLSREALEDEAPVSNPNLRTSAFRNRTREFVWELAEAVGMQDSDLHDPNITIREFLASEGRDRDGVLPEKQTRIAQAREHFFRAFTEKIVRHPDKLMEKLTQFEEGEFRFGKMFLDSHIRDEQGTDMITYEEFSKGYNAIIGAENAGG